MKQKESLCYQCAADCTAAEQPEAYTPRKLCKFFERRKDKASKMAYDELLGGKLK